MTTAKPSVASIVPTEVIETASGTLRAVIYLRVSTTEQAETDYGSDGFSIQAQREACRRHAESMGAAVLDEYVDRGESARSAARPQLQSMLQRLRVVRDVDLVIVHKVDRLARSREDDANIGVDIRTAGARLVSVTENIDETPSGKLVHGIMATIAEFYSSNLAAEARKGMEQKARVGGTVSRAPVGYRNTSAEIEGREVRTVSVDDERAEHVRWAFQQFATGEWTVGQMADALAERGLTSRATRRFPEGPLSRSRVHKMLRNRYYLGIVRYDGVEYAGRHTALIDETLFQDVQAVLDQRSQGKEKPVKRTHYLKGLLACARCGARLGYLHSRGKNGAIYPYFFCLSRQGHRRSGCDLPYLPVDLVEAKVLDLWERVKLDQGEAETIRQDVTVLIRLVSARHESDLSAQRLRLERLEADEAKLLQAHYSDAISLPLMQKEQRRIAQERADAGRIVAAVSLERSALEHALESALDRVNRCDEVYAEGSDRVRRELAFALFARIWVDEGGVAGVDLAEPFAQLLDPSLPEWLEAERASLDQRAEALAAPAFAQNAPPPLAARPDLQRPRGPLAFETKNTALSGRCSNVSLLVGVAGFEPTTSASRTQRSTKLSHTPVLCGGQP